MILGLFITEKIVYNVHQKMHLGVFNIVYNVNQNVYLRVFIIVTIQCTLKGYLGVFIIEIIQGIHF